MSRIFNTIDIEGFGSIAEPLRLNLNAQGLTFVSGNNGSGKSTIFNAIAWVLYGINLKSSISTREDYRTASYRGTRVVLEVSIDGKDYVIARHKDFTGKTFNYKGANKLYVFDSDLQLSTELHKADAQLFITNLLGISSKVFLNSVVFGQRLVRFLETTGTEQRAIFESIFDYDFIERARQNAKENLDAISVENIKLDASIRTLKNDINSKLQHVMDLLQQLDKFNSDKLARIAAITRDIEDTEQQLQDQIEQRLHEQPPKPDSTQLSNTYYALKARKQALVKPVKPSTHCVTCGQPLIDAAAANKRYETELTSFKILSESITHDLKIAEDALNASRKQLEDYNRVYNKNQRILQHNAGIQANKILYEKRLVKLRDDLVLEEAKNSDALAAKINALKDAANSSTLEVTELVDKLKRNEEIHKIVSFWYSTGFTQKGLKSHILDATIQSLNERIIFYASRIGLYVQFSVDTTKKSMPLKIICYNKGKELNYKDFSGGERARIDAIILLAMRDLITANKPFNVLVLDEIFEGLDEEGMADVFDLIKMHEDKSVFIITHQPFAGAINARQWLVTKTNTTHVTT